MLFVGKGQMGELGGQAQVGGSEYSRVTANVSSCRRICAKAGPMATGGEGYVSKA